MTMTETVVPAGKREREHKPPVGSGAFETPTARTYVATIVGTSPYSQSLAVREEKRQGETDDDREKRTWRGRIHADEKGEVFIPPTAFKNALYEIAKYLSERKPGKGQQTYTKHFEAGLAVIDPAYLGVHRDDVAGQDLFLSAKGIRGAKGGARVWRTYPVIPAGWRAKVTIHLIDPVLVSSPAVVRRYLEEAGRLIGIGRFRPSNGGYYGRFNVESFKAA